MSSSSRESSSSGEIDAAVAAWFQALERGAEPDREEFLRQYAHLGPELQQFLQDYDAFRRHVPDANSVLQAAGVPGLAPTFLSPSDAAHASAESLGTVRYFGDYELLREVARGGMGVVYEARQRSLQRRVAVKMILSGHLASPEEVSRFRREAEAAAQLEHPAIVPIYEIGAIGDQHYFSMGYVAGPSLAARLLERPLDPREAATLIRDCAVAVHYAHEQGTVHRDLKPSNILLAPAPAGHAGEFSYSPRVADFGLAKVARTDSSLTHTGQILGTPSYMPPEQAAGHLHDVGPAADVYSLGAVLYACLTGRPPFQSASALDTVRQVMERDPVGPRDLNGAIPRDLETICLKCLEKSIPRRYESAQAVADELQRFLDGRPILARPVSTSERLGRWCRRNPVIAGLMAAVAFTLLLGMGVSSYFAWKEAIRAESEADAHDVENIQRRVAQQQTRIANDALAEQVRLTHETDTARRSEAAQKQAARESEQRARASAEGFRHALYLADLARLPELEDRHQSGEIRRLLLRHVPLESQADLRGFDWYFWWNKVRAQGAVLELPAAVERLAVSLDGTQLAIGCAGGRGYLWKTANQEQPPLVIDSGGKHWSTLSFDAHRNVLYGANEFAAPKAWDTETARVLAAGHPQEVNTFAKPSNDWIPELKYRVPRWPATFSADGQRFLGSSSMLDYVALWDLPHALSSGLTEASTGFYVTGGPPYGRGYALDRLAIKANPDNLLVMMSMPSMATPLRRVPPPDDDLGAPTFSAAVSPDRRWLACGQRNGSVLLMQAADQKLVHRLAAHSDIVWDLTFSADSTWLASAGQDGLSSVWHVPTGTLKSQFRAHDGAVRSVRFVDHDTIATGGDDQDVRLWRRSGGQPQRSLLGHQGRITALAVSAAGCLWSGGQDRFVRIWDLDRRRDELMLPSETMVTGLVASHDGKVAATVSRLELQGGFGVKLWDTETEQLVGDLATDFGVHDLAISPDARFVAVLPKTLFKTRLFDRHSRTEIASWHNSVTTLDDPEIRAPAGQVTPPGATMQISEMLIYLDFTPDSEGLLTIAQTGGVRIREPRSGRVVRNLRLAGKTSRSAFSHDGRHVAFANEREISIFTWPEMQPVSVTGFPESAGQPPVERQCDFLAWSPSGDRLAVTWISDARRADGASQLALLEGEKWQTIVPLGAPDERGRLFDVVFTRDGEQLLTVRDSHVRVWDVANRKLTIAAPLPHDVSNRALSPRSLALAADGETLLIAGAPGKLLRWNLTQQRPLPDLQYPGTPLDDLAWSADGAALVAATSRIARERQPFPIANQPMQLSQMAWNVADGRQASMPTAPTIGYLGRPFLVHSAAALAQNIPIRFDVPEGSDPAVSVAHQQGYLSAHLSRDSAHAVTAHPGGRVIFWRRTAEAKFVAFVPERLEQLPARQMRWSPTEDGTLAVILDGGLALFDRDHGIVWRVDRPQPGFENVGWSHDGRQLITTDGTGRAQLWDAQTGDLIRAFAANSRRVTQALLPPDRTTVLTGDDDGQVLVFDRLTGDLRARIGRHRGAIRSMALSPDQTILATSGDECTVRLWRAAARSEPSSDQPGRTIAAKLEVADRSQPDPKSWAALLTDDERKRDTQASPDVRLAEVLAEGQLPFAYEVEFNRRRLIHPTALPTTETPPWKTAPSFVVEIPTRGNIQPYGRNAPGEQAPRALATIAPPAFRSLPRLRYLSLSGIPWTSAEIAELHHMPSLDTLILSNTRLGEADRALFQGLPALQALDLSGSAATDRVVQSAAAIPGLAHLNLDATAITDAALEALAHREQLISLEVQGTAITDGGIAHLAGLKRLQSLNLNRTHVTDACIPVLRSLPALATVHVDETELTHAGLIALLESGRQFGTPPLSLVKDNPELIAAVLGSVEIDGQKLTAAEAMRAILNGQHITGWTGSLESLTDAEQWAILTTRLPALDSICITDTGSQLPSMLRGLLPAADRLRSLSLSASGNRHADAFDSLERWHHLQRISIKRLKSESLRSFRKLPIESLALPRCETANLTDIVDAFPRLRELILADNDNWTDAQLAEIGRLAELEIVDLRDTRAGERTFAALKQLPKLKWVGVAPAKGRVPGGLDPKIFHLSPREPIPRIELSPLNPSASAP